MNRTAIISKPRKGTVESFTRIAAKTAVPLTTIRRKVKYPYGKSKAGSIARNNDPADTNSVVR